MAFQCEGRRYEWRFVKHQRTDDLPKSVLSVDSHCQSPCKVCASSANLQFHAVQDFLLPGTWFVRPRDFFAVKFALPFRKAPAVRCLPNWLAFVFGAKSVLLSRVSLGKGCAERSIFSAIYTSTKNNRGFGWTVNKRESQLWQKMLGYFHASTEQIWADMSLDMSEKCHEMPTRSSENSQLVGTECLESSLQDTDTRKLQGVCGKDKLGNIIESCTSKKWGALEALLQMSAIGAAFGCSKACDIIAEDALSVAS